MKTALPVTIYRHSFIRKHALVCLLACAFVFWCVPAANSQEPVDGVSEAIVLFERGQGLHEKGDIPAAIELYKEAIRLYPEFPEAEYQLGTALRSTGDNDAAEAAFRRAVELREDWTLALAALGSILSERLKFTEAETVLRKAIELDDKNYPAYSALANVLLLSDASPEKLTELLASITNVTSGKMNPPASAWLARGSIERRLKMYTAADVSLNKALEHDPANVQVKFEKAEVALARKDPATAKRFANELVAARVDTPELNVLRANIYLAEGDVSAAIAILEKIDRPAPEIVQFRTGLAAYASDDTEKLEEMAANKPNEIGPIARLCSLFRVKDPEKALNYCRRASELEPEDIGHAIGFAAALVQAKRYPDAVVLLKKLLEYAPDNYTARANLATALFMQNDFTAAKAEYRRLLDAQPNTAIAYYFLAICHDRLGEYLDAMANYQAFIRHADPKQSRLEIEKTNLRLPALQKQIDKNGGKRR